MFSPFQQLRWNEPTKQFEVRIAELGSKWSGLISIQGVMIEDLVKHAKDDMGSAEWQDGFVVMLAEYMEKCGTKITSGKKTTVELEDLATHEIDEFSTRWTEDNFASCQETWAGQNVPPSVSAANADIASSSDADENFGNVEEADEDEDEENAGKRLEYLENKEKIDIIGDMFVAALRAATAMKLSTMDVEKCYQEVGGHIMTHEELETHKTAQEEKDGPSAPAMSPMPGMPPGMAGMPMPGLDPQQCKQQ